MKKTEATLSQALELGLSAEEYGNIIDLLGRTPNQVELFIYSKLWSDECSEKNTVQWLQTLPKTTSINDTPYAISIEKERGKNSLPLNYAPQAIINIQARKQDDTNNEISGLDEYGTILGAKTSQQIFYMKNAPTANGGTFSVGIKTFETARPEVDNVVYLVTHAEISASDPIAAAKYEQSILKAFAEASGAGNLLCSQRVREGGIVEAFSRLICPAGLGAKVELPKQSVSIIDHILDSNSYGHSLLSTDKSNAEALEQIFLKHHVTLIPVGEVTASDLLLLFHDKELIASLPIASIHNEYADLHYKKEFKEPEYLQRNKEFTINDIDEPEDLKEVARFMMKLPNISSLISSSDTLYMDRSEDPFMITSSGNSQYTHADPKLGAEINIATCTRRIAACGGTPKTIAGSLSVGSADQPELYWEFVESIKGMSSICDVWKLSVLDTDIQFNSENDLGQTTFSTCVLGEQENTENYKSDIFQNKGDLIFIIGSCRNDISSSEYLTKYHQVEHSPAPFFNINEELQIQEAIRTLIQKDLINAAKSCELGGLFTGLVKMSVTNDLGFDVETDLEVRPDAFLFGESQSRIIVGVSQDQEEEFIAFMSLQKTPFTLLGHVTQGKMVIDGEHFGFVEDLGLN